MKHRLLLALSFAVCLPDCATSGQTGSPDCVGPVSCVCDPLYSAGVLLRVRADSFNGSRLEATVGATLPADARMLDIVAGDRVAGQVTLDKPCDGTTSIELADGADLLVLYFPGNASGYPNCDEEQACYATECAGLNQEQLEPCWTACANRTGDVCEQHRRDALLDGVFLWAVPWTEQLSFGGGLELPTSEVSVLYDVETCLKRFPPDPAPPCNDVRTNCAVSRGRRGDASFAWFALVALALSGFMRRRWA